MGHRLRLRAAFHTDGSMAIEYGLILPVLLLFTLGLMDASRLLWTNITLTRATEVAARCGAVNNTATCPSIAAYAATQAQNFGIADAKAANFTPTPRRLRRAGRPATYNFHFVVPWFPQFGSRAPFGGTTMPLNATACYPKQY